MPIGDPHSLQILHPVRSYRNMHILVWCVLEALTYRYRFWDIDFDQCSHEFCPGLSAFCENVLHLPSSRPEKNDPEHGNMALKRTPKRASLRVNRHIACPKRGGREHVCLVRLAILATRRLKMCKLSTKKGAILTLKSIQKVHYTEPRWPNLMTM